MLLERSRREMVVGNASTLRQISEQCTRLNCCLTNIEDRLDNSRFIVLQVDDGQGSERHVVTD